VISSFNLFRASSIFNGFLVNVLDAFSMFREVFLGLCAFQFISSDLDGWIRFLSSSNVSARRQAKSYRFKGVAPDKWYMPVSRL